jgi:choline dehydrogenase-like flavoprotein
VVFLNLLAARLTEKFSDTTMFKSLGAKLLGRSHPKCSSFDSGSDAYWECYVRHNAFPVVHRVSGTCRMGSADDASSVVDPELK